MKLLLYIRLALRYLTGYLRRYRFLFLVIAFGFAVISLITGLKAGMDQGIYKTARSHYGGDLIVTGNDKSSRLSFRLTEPETVLKAAEQAGLSYNKVVYRSVFGAKGLVYFYGKAVRHKYVSGVDWQREAELFRSLPLSSGSLRELPTDDEIILSSPVARELLAQPGDRLILEVETLRGQKNTGTFRLKAVVESTGIFGAYKCYISRTSLNRLLALKPSDCSSVGFYLSDPGTLSSSIQSLHGPLSDLLATGPIVHNRDELDKANREKWKGIRHQIMSLPVYLSEVSQLLDAVQILAYILYGAMLLISAASVAVTFRLILHERQGELATMRAIGFHRPELFTILFFELIVLYLCALVSGFFIAIGGFGIISHLSFSSIPSFEIFMQSGRLLPKIEPKQILQNGGAMFAVLLPIIIHQSIAALRRPLSSSLSGGIQ